MNPNEYTQENTVDHQGPENQVISYTAPWTIFAMGFSNRPQYPFRLALASFVAETKN